MKTKSDSILEQSAVIPFLENDGDPKIILVTAKSSKKWIIPKGNDETGMPPYESAAKEALEEAGVLGTVSKEFLMDYDYEKKGRVRHVKVYSLKVTEMLEDWDERSTRERRIVGLTEAMVFVKPELKWILFEFRRKYLGLPY